MSSLLADGLIFDIADTMLCILKGRALRLIKQTEKKGSKGPEVKLSQQDTWFQPSYSEMTCLQVLKYVAMTTAMEKLRAAY